MVFFYLDLNPATAVFTAEGTVYADRVAALQDTISNHPLKKEFSQATRILIVHAHPLPVPHQGRDFLLATRGTHHLLAFMAAQRIHMVLHGHKHFATWSHMRVGGATDHAHFLEILGAGSAMKDGDTDKRGHNFNLITISDAGVRRVRQFFKLPAAGMFEERPPSEPEREMQALVTRKYSARYRIGEIRCTAVVDGEGTAKNFYEMRGIDFRGASDGAIRLPTIRNEFGGTGGYVLADGFPAGWYLAPISAAKPDEYELRCPGARGDATQDSVTVENQGYGTFALDANGALNIGLARVKGAAAFEERFTFTLRESVDRLRLEVRFPATFSMQGASVEVTENDQLVRNEAVTRRAASALSALPHSVVLDLVDPEPNLTYRITWRIPFARLEDGQIAMEARRVAFERNLWAALRADGSDVRRALAKFGEIVLGELMDRLGTAGMPLEDIDLSLLVRDLDRPVAPGQSDKPALYQAAGDPALDGKLVRCVGQGNAGVAYLSGDPRFFDPDSPGPDGTLESGVEERTNGFLASYPLVDGRSGLPFVVVNIGVRSAVSARVMRSLVSQASVRRVWPQLQTSVLRPLLKLARLEEEAPNGDSGGERGDPNTGGDHV